MQGTVWVYSSVGLAGEEKALNMFRDSLRLCYIPLVGASKQRCAGKAEYSQLHSAQG